MVYSSVSPGRKRPSVRSRLTTVLTVFDSTGRMVDTAVAEHAQEVLIPRSGGIEPELRDARRQLSRDIQNVGIVASHRRRPPRHLRQIADLRRQLIHVGAAAVEEVVGGVIGVAQDVAVDLELITRDVVVPFVGDDPQLGIEAVGGNREAR